jgi:hypothetical protein
MTTFKKGDTVFIKHMSGDTAVHEDDNLRVVGAAAYVHSIMEESQAMFLTIPTHRYYYQQGSYFALPEEVEKLEGAHPLTKESQTLTV